MSETISINGVDYVRADSVPAAQRRGRQLLIWRKLEVCKNNHIKQEDYD
jgi:hypothetical protein